MKTENEKGKLKELYYLDLTKRVLDYVAELCPLYHSCKKINLEQIAYHNKEKNFTLEKDNSINNEIKNSIFAYDCRNENYKEEVERCWSEPWRKNRIFTTEMRNNVDFYRIEAILTTLIVELDKNKEKIINMQGEMYYEELIKKIESLNELHNKKCQEFIRIYYQTIEMIDNMIKSYKKISKIKRNNNKPKNSRGRFK